MRAHVIENGVVTNTIIVDDLNIMPNLIDAGSGGQVGDIWDGNTFTTPSRYATLEEAVAAKHVEIDALRDEKLAIGFPYIFPDAAGTIQTRDIRDYINILGSVVAGILLNGQEVTLPFRDMEDNNHSLTPAESAVMGVSALSSYTAIYKAAWTIKDSLKDFVEGGATIAEIEAYDITTGWPE